MKINTSRFGPVDVDEQRVITFPSGLLGFTTYKKYVLFQGTDESHFYWLQSLGAPDLAFVVTDPASFVHDYTVPLQSEQVQAMGIQSASDAQVFVIVNKRGRMLTGNLQGPLVIHATSRVGQQLVLADRRYHTRVTLMELPSTTAASA
jgi:flagellar assembly factor FliW